MANRKNIVDRLKAGDVLLMDGGTGSEIQRRGVDVLRGAETDMLKAWSATANIDNADVVQQVHQDYLRVGADIIISNNFWTIPYAMGLIGLRDRWKEYAGAAADNAIKARAAGNPEAYVAGGIAAPTVNARTESDASDVEQMGADAVREEFAKPARLLADAGADAILPEYVGYIEDCVAAVDGCAEAGVPVFLGVRHIQRDGRMQYDESLVDLAAALKGHPVDAGADHVHRSRGRPQWDFRFLGTPSMVPWVSTRTSAITPLDRSPTGRSLRTGVRVRGRTSCRRASIRLHAWQISPASGRRWAPR